MEACRLECFQHRWNPGGGKGERAIPDSLTERVVFEMTATEERLLPLPRFLHGHICPACGEHLAACHLCAELATHFLEIDRGTLYLCSSHSALAHAWEDAGFGEYGAYAPTVDCECDPWRFGSP